MQALALGADAVLVGRPILHGLTVDGQAGVEKVLNTLKKELKLNMALAGAALQPVCLAMWVGAAQQGRQFDCLWSKWV